MGVLGMNYRQMKALKLGDIVYQKLGPPYRPQQDMGNLCVVLEVTPFGGVRLADTLTNARYWCPYQRLYTYDATDEHKALGVGWGFPLPYQSAAR